MKFQVELTYTIQDEPAIFKEISELCSRKVYIWATKRAYLESDSPLSVFTRASMMNEMVGPGYLEMWGESTDETCPPSNIDDEWVESYKQDLIGDVLLVEPSIKPFNQLVSNYQHDNKFIFKNVVISEYNGFVDFFTDVNSDSESSSLILDNLLKNEKTSISNKIRSLTPNNLFTNFTPDWLHVDAEGYDAKILLLIDDEHLHKLKFIIWEHIHLDDEIERELKEKLESFNFTVIVGLDYNTFAIKN